MSIDPKYIAASDLELFLVDKMTGKPLSAGTLEFFSDTNRSQRKAIYTISGTAPNYTFVELLNPSTLSLAGTFQDEDGNNVIPYYYPYDNQGNIDLYYIEVKSSGGVEQFTREAWPPQANTGGGDLANANAINYIPNGQFVAHNEIEPDEIADTVAGEVTQSVTSIAPGGWTYARSEDSTSVDNIQFFRYGEFVDNPSASPRYAIQYSCTSPDSGDVFKEIRVRFEDVNKFASDAMQYTFSFTATTYNSGGFPLTLRLIKNYGTGGSPSATTETTIAAFAITSATRLFQTTFVFGSNEGTTVGTNDDDYLELAISIPTNIACGLIATDFCMLAGNINISGFPQETDRDMMARTLVPTVPDPDGYDLYLPLVLTKDGLSYDDSQIGLIEAAQYVFPTSLSPTTNLMLCDGAQYLVSEYTDLGIPLNRLWSRAIWNSVYSQPKFGTGSNFVTTYIQESSTANLFLSTNRFGTTAAPADGVSQTGFTFFPVYEASSTGYGLTAYQQSSTTSFVKATTAGYVATAPTVNTSGFTIDVYRNPSNVSTYLMFTITTIAATTLASKYFRFTTLPGPTNYYMWFKVDGTGTDPAIGGATGIEVDLKSTYTAADVSAIVTNAIAGTGVDVITTDTANTLSAGDYFTFGTPNSNTYIAWYSIDGVGSKPAASALLKIQVPVLSADTAAQVASKTMIALNSVYFAAPNLQGAFLRGYDPNKIWDLDADTRLGNSPTFYGNLLGTFEIDQLISHHHTTPGGGSTGPNPGYINGISSNTSPGNTQDTGGADNRPINFNVNWAIRY